ncbi:uncharacterized protein [Clytia hemisphaerica]|uniref:uncharacterized protein n=1 Tax=Clytia hemisphaerica TaxID=252671 RepID=UPI0034D520E7
MDSVSISLKTMESNQILDQTNDIQTDGEEMFDDKEDLLPGFTQSSTVMSEIKTIIEEICNKAAERAFLSSMPTVTEIIYSSSTKDGDDKSNEGSKDGHNEWQSNSSISSVVPDSNQIQTTSSSILQEARVKKQNKKRKNRRKGKESVVTKKEERHEIAEIGIDISEATSSEIGSENKEATLERQKVLSGSNDRTNISVNAVNTSSSLATKASIEDRDTSMTEEVLTCQKTEPKKRDALKLAVKTVIEASNSGVENLPKSGKSFERRKKRRQTCVNMKDLYAAQEMLRSRDEPRETKETVAEMASISEEAEDNEPSTKNFVAQAFGTEFQRPESENNHQNTRNSEIECNLSAEMTEVGEFDVSETSEKVVSDAKNELEHSSKSSQRRKKSRQTCVNMKDLKSAQVLLRNQTQHQETKEVVAKTTPISEEVEDPEPSTTNSTNEEAHIGDTEFQQTEPIRFHQDDLMQISETMPNLSPVIVEVKESDASKTLENLVSTSKSSQRRKKSRRTCVNMADLKAAQEMLQNQTESQKTKVVITEKTAISEEGKGDRPLTVDIVSKETKDVELQTSKPDQLHKKALVKEMCKGNNECRPRQKDSESKVISTRFKPSLPTIKEEEDDELTSVPSEVIISAKTSEESIKLTRKSDVIIYVSAVSSTSQFNVKTNQFQALDAHTTPRAMQLKQEKLKLRKKRRPNVSTHKFQIIPPLKFEVSIRNSQQKPSPPQLKKPDEEHEVKNEQEGQSIEPPTLVDNRQQIAKPGRFKRFWNLLISPSKWCGSKTTSESHQNNLA